MDIGEYKITKNEAGVYEVVEMISGKDRTFSTVSDMLEWIRQDIEDVESESK